MNQGSSSKYDLLTDPLIHVRAQGSTLAMSLPEVLEMLGGDGEISFPHLRPHQKHAGHAFLVQLAALALHTSYKGNPAQPSGRWTELLTELAEGNRCAWRLVVEDLSEPAFMQPPVPEGKLEEWKTIRSPDEVSPAHAGMDPARKAVTFTFTSFPRTRGDGRKKEPPELSSSTLASSTFEQTRIISRLW